MQNSNENENRLQKFLLYTNKSIHLRTASIYFYPMNVKRKSDWESEKVGPNYARVCENEMWREEEKTALGRIIILK